MSDGEKVEGMTPSEGSPNEEVGVVSSETDVTTTEVSTIRDHTVPPTAGNLNQEDVVVEHVDKVDGIKFNETSEEADELVLDVEGIDKPVVEEVSEDTTTNEEGSVGEHISTQGELQAQKESSPEEQIVDLEQEAASEAPAETESRLEDKPADVLEKETITGEDLSRQEVHPTKALADDLEEDGDGDFEVVDAADVPKVEEISAYELEMKQVGAEIIFPPSTTAALPGDQWTNLKWMSYTRFVRSCDVCTRMTLTKKKWFAGAGSAESYHTRKLAIYKEPNLILVLRATDNMKEVQSILDIGNEPIDPRRYLIAETVIDPMTCKLRLSPLTTSTSIESSAGGDNATPQRLTCFELVTPTETVLLSALRPREDSAVLKNSVGFIETKTMEVAVGNALYAAHCPVEQDKFADISWKHQLVLGTLTSFVVSGSQKQLEKAIVVAMARNSDGSKTVPSHVIDQVDESGRTALHYACARRNSTAVTALIGAGASVSIPMKTSEEDEVLPIHLAARTLDHMSLSTILSAPRRPNPNALDSSGRTAMYLAATEGESPDPMALSKCLSALEAWGGEMGSLLNPVHVLAAQWKYTALGHVLAHRGYRYPLPTAGMSVAAFHLYPVHTALLELRKKIQAVGEQKQDHGFGGADTLRSQLRGTLTVLFEHGLEPNERLERVTDPAVEGKAELMEHVGFTPLQVLAAAALDAEQLSKAGIKIPSSVLASIASTLAGAADVLLQCGARMAIEPPPTERLLSKSSSTASSESAEMDESTRSLPETDRPKLKIDGNKDLLDLLGGKERLEACKKAWLEQKCIEGTKKMMIHQDKPLNDSDAPGGSNEKSCAICWSTFGTLMNRKHKCRVSLKYVCDDCSTKRVKEDGKEYRLSDGQFLLARADIVRQKSDKITEQRDAVQQRKDKMEAVRRQREEKEKAEEASRDGLFGGIMDKATSLLAGEDIEKDTTTGLQASLGQTRDALNQRGERLGALSEKTEKLMNASEDFAKMAKELEKAQSGGMFW